MRLPPLAYRKIMCPIPDEKLAYTMINIQTGDMSECADLSKLLRIMARELAEVGGFFQIKCGSR